METKDLEGTILDSLGIEELESQGYKLLKKIGEGWTRVAYLALFKKGLLERLRVLKIPKAYDPNIKSAVTLMNLSRPDYDINEILLSNEIRHKNLAEIIDIIQYKGKNIIVEEYVDGFSLEFVVKNFGPIKDEDRFYDIFSQVIDGLEYLIDQKRILHRDIKPSNVIVGKHEVKITDLQNAKRIIDIEPKISPTRGGTRFSHPKIVLGLMNNQLTCANVGTEIYSIASTMYYALTGEPFLNLSLEVSDVGHKVKLYNGTEISVRLKDDKGNDIRSIDQHSYEKLLREKLKRVPKKFRKLLKKALSYNPKYTTLGEFKRDFELIYSKDKKRERLRQMVKRRLTELILLGCVTCVGITAYKTAKAPVVGIDFSNGVSKLEKVISSDYLNTSIDNTLNYGFVMAGHIDKHNQERLYEQIILYNKEWNERLHDLNNGHNIKMIDKISQGYACKDIIKAVLLEELIHGFSISNNNKFNNFAIYYNHRPFEAITKQERLKTLAEYVATIYEYEGRAPLRTLVKVYLTNEYENNQNVIRYHREKAKNKNQLPEFWFINKLPDKDKQKILSTYALYLLLQDKESR